jgi:hypothetical protein
MLDAARLDVIFRDCLFTNDELVNGKPPADAVLVEGVVSDFGFHRKRLESHRQEVIDALNELPAVFHKSGGGGWTFLNAGQDKSGRQWGQHRNVEQLLCLGVGLGLAGYCLSKELWYILPSRMPYFYVSTPEKK